MCQFPETGKIDIQAITSFTKINFKTYPNGVMGTTFCSYFYGKVDVNMVNDNGQTIVSYLAKIGQLHQATIDLLLDHDFDFLSTTNGNSYKMIESFLKVFV